LGFVSAAFPNCNRAGVHAQHDENGRKREKKSPESGAKETKTKAKHGGKLNLKFEFECG
jgi:hypothetical protein